MHTTGKLRLDKWGNICTENGHRLKLRNVATTDSNITGDVPEAEANDRRLVALWNALDGIPTAALEADCVRKLVEAARELVERVDACDERALLDLDDDPHPPSTFSVMADAVRQALKPFAP